MAIYLNEKAREAHVVALIEALYAQATQEALTLAHYLGNAHKAYSRALVWNASVSAKAAELSRHMENAKKLVKKD